MARSVAARIGRIGAVLVGIGVSALLSRWPRPLQADGVYEGKSTEVGGKFTCDCQWPVNHSCFCVVGS
jgi:hypothetical protein